jgi:hypothetical protein
LGGQRACQLLAVGAFARDGVNIVTVVALQHRVFTATAVKDMSVKEWQRQQLENLTNGRPVQISSQSLLVLVSKELQNASTAASAALKYKKMALE